MQESIKKKDRFKTNLWRVSKKEEEWQSYYNYLSSEKIEAGYEFLKSSKLGDKEYFVSQLSRNFNLRLKTLNNQHYLRYKLYPNIIDAFHDDCTNNSNKWKWDEAKWHEHEKRMETINFYYDSMMNLKKNYSDCLKFKNTWIFISLNLD